jgi:DNA repair protein RecO (recombination protein O)
LRSVDYGESDRIVTLFTQKMGKISALARGARKSWRRFGGALEPFSIFEVSLAPGRGGLQNLEEAVLKSAHIELAKDLTRMEAGAFVLELVREVVPECEAQPGIFEVIEEMLPLVSQARGLEIGLIATAAELKVLSFAGVAVSVDRCNACGRKVPENKKVRFHPARGGVVCTECGGGPIILSADAVRALTDLSRLPLLKSTEVKINGADAADVDKALAGFVEHHVERPLRKISLLGR